MTERSGIYRHVVLFQFNDATPQAKDEVRALSTVSDGDDHASRNGEKQ
jgi:hypothetical protein